MARRGSGKKKAQLNVLNEIRKQLVLQAERWGRTEYYTTVKMEEYELEACERIRSQFLAEKSNLEYELHLLDSDKRDVLIKIERLNSYILKTERVMQRHGNNLDNIFENKYGEAYKAIKALKRSGFLTNQSVSTLNQ
ncbi:MAG: hypothetical protein NT099_00475 [Candidatus Saganbacteria bacterium]|nr:hypothetical protein [Candidatus Saganbacteria bacterium]